jgi:hypothetical protein
LATDLDAGFAIGDFEFVFFTLYFKGDTLQDFGGGDTVPGGFIILLIIFGGD